MKLLVNLRESITPSSQVQSPLYINQSSHLGGQSPCSSRQLRGLLRGAPTVAEFGWALLASARRPARAGQSKNDLGFVGPAFGTPAGFGG